MNCKLNKKKELSEEIKQKIEQVTFFLGFIESNNITDYEITITKEGIKFKDIVAKEKVEFDMIRNILNKDK